MQTTDRQFLTSPIGNPVQSTPVGSSSFSIPGTKLPLIPVSELTVGTPIERDIPGLSKGEYQGQPVTLFKVNIAVLPSHQTMLAALMQSVSPFWLPIKGISEEEKSSTLVLAVLPNTGLSIWLSTVAAWAMRCRMVRDVAVGLYQCRAAGATHISWSLSQLFLDTQGRVQILPGLSETAIAESDDVFALGHLLWCMVSRSTTLVEGWQQGKGLPRDCPPALISLIQACTDPVASARPSLKALAKGLDVFWQRAEQGLSDALPALLQVRSTIKEQKYDSPVSQSLETPGPAYYELDSLMTGSPELKQTGTSPTPVWINPTDEKEQKVQATSSSSTASLTTSVSSGMTHSVLASGSLNLLLIDDQTVGWLSATDPRYQAGVKLCTLRDSIAQPVESKASLPALQQEIQRTLIGSPVEMLLWLGEEGEDPGHSFQEVAWRLWQTPVWQAYRPGDPPPTPWLPLLVNMNQPSVNSPLLTRTHQPPEAVTNFTESEWWLLQSQYALFWLVQGVNGLTEPCNLYDANKLYQPGRTRLLLHSEKSVVFKLEESTYWMPHNADGQLLPARYARFTTDVSLDWNAWEGRYLGAIGLGAQSIGSDPLLLIPLTPAKDLALNPKALVLPVADEKTTLGKGAFGEVLRGSYYGQPVAVKRFKEAKLSASDQAQLKDEAAVMANLHSPFLISLLGLSLESPPLLVMELAQGGSLYQLLKDETQELPWAWRLRILRDIALGLSVLHLHELLHRDLKSLNILLDAHGRAKLCDFGLSTLKSQAKDTSDVGTLLWNAPEVLQGKAATPASDLFSFAILCWEVATRRLPYKDSTTGKFKEGFAERVQAGEREIIPTDCPPELAAVIRACWAQNPNERPTASQVAQVLEGLWQTAVKAEQSQLALNRKTSSVISTAPSISLESKRIKSLTPIKTKEKLPLAQVEMKKVVSADTSSSQSIEGLPNLSPEMLASLMLAPPKKKVETAEKKTDQPVKHDNALTVEFKTLLAESSVPRWQDKELPNYTVSVKLYHLRQTVLRDPYITQELSCYIAPNGQSHPGQPADSLGVWVKRHCLEGAAQVLLFLGAGGAGKSTFTRDFLRQLWLDPIWESYRPGDPLPDVFLPLWIPLGSSDVNPENLWDYFYHLGFTTAERIILQRQGRLIFLADGYDEIRRQTAPNLYDSNRFREYAQVKILISCRSQRLQNLSEADAFVPHTEDGRPDWSIYQRRYIAPFTAEQTQEYIVKYVQRQQGDQGQPTRWNAERYQHELAKIPGLKILLDTPFMLWMTLSILPDLANESAQSETKTTFPLFTRAALYDRYTHQWFSRQANKAWQTGSYLQNPAAILGKSAVQAIKERALREGQEDVQIHWYKQGYRALCFAFASQLKAAGQVNLAKTQMEVKENKGGDHLKLWQGCPLRESSDGTVSFIHNSLADYFVTTLIAEAILLGADSTLPFIVGEFDRAYALNVLNQGRFTAEQVHFLVDRVRMYPLLQEELFTLIERSKTEESMAMAAANAITVLNSHGVNFSDKELSHIRIPGADLTGGLFHKTKLREADLSGVNFTDAFLDEADLSGSRMPDVILGERPVMKGHNSLIRCMAYDLDHDLAATGSGRKDGDCGIRIWDIAESQLIEILVGHTDEVIGLSFIPQKTEAQLISLSKDNTIRIWNVEAGTLLETVTPPAELLGPVSLSANGRFLAVAVKETQSPITESKEVAESTSISTTLTESLTDEAKQTSIPKIHILDLTSKQWVSSFAPHDKQLVSLQWSTAPDCLLLATSGTDEADHLKLWGFDSQNTLTPSLQWQQTTEASPIIFLPDGTELLTRENNGVSLREIKQGELIRFYRSKLTTRIQSLACDPTLQCQYVAAGDQENIEVWDKHTGQSLTHLFGHSNLIQTLYFSPKSKLLISASHDKTLHFWETDRFVRLNQDTACHTMPVTSMVLTPDSKTLISGSLDGTVRFWQANTGHLQAAHQITEAGISALCLSDDGQDLYIGDKAGVIYCFQFSPFKKLATLKADHGEISALAGDIVNKQKMLFSGCTSEILNQWNLADYKFHSNIYGKSKSNQISNKIRIVHIAFIKGQWLYPFLLCTRDGDGFSDTEVFLLHDKEPSKFLELRDTSYAIATKISSVDYIIYANSEDYQLRWQKMFQEKSGVIEQIGVAHQIKIKQISILKPARVLSRDKEGHVFIWEKGIEKPLIHLFLGTQLENIIINSALDRMYFLRAHDHSVYSFDFDLKQESYTLSWRRGQVLSGKFLKISNVINISQANRSILCSAGASEYNRIYTLQPDEKPSQFVKPDAIILEFNENCCKAYWLHQNEISSISLPLTYLETLYSKLPKPGEESQDFEIIQSIVGKYSIYNFYTHKNLRKLNHYALDRDGNTSLIYAILQDDEEKVKHLLENKVYLDQISFDGLTPLSRAIELKRESIVRQLLKHRANVNLKNEEGSVALNSACLIKENKAIVTLLLDHKADINSTNGESKISFLHYLAQTGVGEDIIGELIAYKADINQALRNGVTALHLSVIKNNESIVRKLLECKADVNIFFKGATTPPPLFAAIQHNRANMISLLVEYKADVNLKVVNGNTKLNPLYYAVEFGWTPIVKQLLSLKARIEDQPGSEDQTISFLLRPVELGHDQVVSCLLEHKAELTSDLAEKLLFNAVLRGHDKVSAILLGAMSNKEIALNSLFGCTLNYMAIVRLFIEHKADVNARTGELGSTNLHVAIALNKVETFTYLLEQKALVNLADYKDHTPLYTASTFGREEFVKQLLTYHADVNLADKDGMHSLEAAALNGHAEIVTLLLEHQAAVDLLNSQDGATALHDAALVGHSNLVAKLLEKKANINHADKSGDTALHKAVSRGQQTVVTQLLEHKADINCQNKDFLTSLDLALTENRADTVKQLLEHEAIDNMSIPSINIDSIEVEKMLAINEAEKSFLLGEEKHVADEDYLTGIAYRRGYEVKVDNIVSLAAFQKAADLGHLRAQYYVGLMYKQGEGVVKDEKLAQSIFEKSFARIKLQAESQPDAWAAYMLAEMYRGGEGINTDAEEANRWYRIAIPLLLKSARKGAIVAQYLLGCCYGYGDGVTQRSRIAVYWYRLAAMQGYAQGQYAIGEYYENNYGGVGCDLTIAKNWYYKAAAQGLSYAEDKLLEFKKISQETSIAAETKEIIPSTVSGQPSPIVLLSSQEKTETGESKKDDEGSSFAEKLPQGQQAIENTDPSQVPVSPPSELEIKLVITPTVLPKQKIDSAEGKSTITTSPDVTTPEPTLTTPLLAGQPSSDYGGHVLTQKSHSKGQWGSWMNIFRNTTSEPIELTAPVAEEDVELQAASQAKGSCCRCIIL